MNKITAALLLSFLLLPLTAFGHARLISPVPRDPNPGLKTGPCGGILPTGNPTEYEAGSTVTISWEETINHPGRFIFSFSPANDAGFDVNQLAVVIDTQDGGGLPHQYMAQITLPSTPCDNCTLQMIQSMEENPANPRYYYSCADIRLTAPAGSGEGEGGGDQGSLAGDQLQDGDKPAFGGGCGTVSGGPPAGSGPLSLVILLLMPLLLAVRVRSYS